MLAPLIKQRRLAPAPPPPAAFTSSHPSPPGVSRDPVAGYQRPGWLDR
jgi:hypothetical protein